MTPALPPDSQLRHPFAEAPSSAWGKRSWTQAWSDTAVTHVAPVTQVRVDDAPVDDNNGKGGTTEDLMNCGSLTHLTEEMDALVKDFGEQVKALVTCHVHLPVSQGEQADVFLGVADTAQEHEANSRLERSMDSSQPVLFSSQKSGDSLPGTRDSSVVRSVTVRSGRAVTQIVKEAVSLPYTADECLFEASRTKLIRDQTWLQRWTRSQCYEWWSGALIFANALFIGIQTEYSALQTREAGIAGQAQTVGEAPGFLIGSAIFTVLFTIELSIRWVSEGFFGLFQMVDGQWYLFDLAIVILSWFDSGASLIYLSQEKTGQAHVFGSISVLRILRMARIVKLARVIRLLSFFRELRLMVYSILSSLKSLIWLTLILVCTFYVFAITFTSGLVSNASPKALWNDESLLGVRESFGTLGRSLLSLYKSMSGGRNWGDYYEMLEEVLPAQYTAIFLCFITFTIFAVMNTVTGVFVELAMRANVNSRQVTINEELASKRKFLRDLHSLFIEMDVNGDGSISYDEFCQRLSDERVIAYFKALSLDVHDTQSLFQLLDVDGSQNVDMAEFLNGCYQLQGDARSIDTKMIRMTLKRAVEQMHALRQAQNEQKVVLAQQANMLAVTIYRANHLSGDTAVGDSKGSDSKLVCNTETGSTLASCGNGTAKATVPETPVSHADSRRTSMSHAHPEATDTKRTQVAAMRPQQCVDDEVKQHDWDQVPVQGDAWDSHLHQFLATDPSRGGSRPSWGN